MFSFNVPSFLLSHILRHVGYPCEFFGWCFFSAIFFDAFIDLNVQLLKLKNRQKKPKLTGIPSSPDPPQESEKNTAAKPVGIPYTLERLLTQTSLASPMFLPP